MVRSAVLCNMLKIPNLHTRTNHAADGLRGWGKGRFAPNLKITRHCSCGELWNIVETSGPAGAAAVLCRCRYSQGCRHCRGSSHCSPARHYFQTTRNQLKLSLNRSGYEDCCSNNIVEISPHLAEQECLTQLHWKTMAIDFELLNFYHS